MDPVWAFLYDLTRALGDRARGHDRRLAPPGRSRVDAVGALVIAWLLAVVSTRLAVGDWPALGTTFWGGSDSPAFPAVRLAEASAVIFTLSPHLVRPLRRTSRWLVVLGVLSALLVGPATPGGTFAGLLVAIVAAAGTRLAFGTSAGRPGLSVVAAALSELGVVAEDLAVAERQSAGVFVVEGRDGAGRPLLVKVYGRDAYDTQLVAKLWRTLWYQDSGPPLRLGRGQAAEHEAFVTLLARNGGVPTREVVTAGETRGGDALLVLRGAGSTPRRRLGRRARRRAAPP